MVFCISAVLVVMSPFPFLILFIWVLSPFFLVSLARGVSILFTLSKNQLLVLLIFFYCYFILCFRDLRLGSAKWWHWLPVQVSLHSSCCKPVAAFSSEAPKLLLCPSWSLHWWGDFPGCRNLASLTAPCRGAGPIPISFSLSFFFCPTWLHGDFLALFRGLRSSASVQ